MGPAIIVVDSVKNKHLKAIMFARLCEEMSEAYLIFFTMNQNGCLGEIF